MSRLTVFRLLMLSNGALNTRAWVARSVALPLKRNFSVRTSAPTAAITSPAGSLNTGPVTLPSNCCTVNLPPYSVTPLAEVAARADRASGVCDWPAARNGFSTPVLISAANSRPKK